MEGVPNTNIDIRNRVTGEIIQRKKVDRSCKVIKDYDNYHRGKKDKHVHVYDDTVRKIRRDLYKKEYNKMKKAEKGRWW